MVFMKAWLILTSIVAIWLLFGLIAAILCKLFLPSHWAFHPSDFSDAKVMIYNGLISFIGAVFVLFGYSIVHLCDTVFDLDPVRKCKEFFDH